LRRSSTDRVAAGVSGGLGEYFGIDPVIFRVLFAITAFFGIGVVAYLIAWAIIPDVGSTNPPLDRMVAELRRRHVPLWLVAVVGVVLAWAVVASWWAPWPMVPIALAAVVLVAAFNRQGRSFAGPPATPAGFPSDPVQTVSMHKTAPNPSPYGWDSGTTTPLDESAFPPPVPAPAPSAFANWVSEARAARKARRHRNLPMRIATWGIWILAVAVLAIIDAIHRIPMPTYLWLSVGIVVAALAVGAAVRRPVFGFAVALLPLAILLFALGPTRASLHDGSGDYTYAPTSASALDSHYRTAFGRTTLDLSDLPALTSPTTITITQAAGQVRVLVPRSVNVTVISHVHIGTVDLDNSNRRGGVGITEPIRLNAGTGSTLTINVDLADGDVSVQNRS
jgi:phage shock protein PspC (stress-responsive transcriptional regulator)